jgi:hypothetical protein
MDKVTESRPGVAAKGQNKVKGTAAAAGQEVRNVSADPLSAIRRAAGTDPNVALVGFRIEIEKKIIAIAEKIGIETHRVPLYALLQELQTREILNVSTVDGLLELMAAGNRAAHGTRVSNEAADWVLDIGPGILNRLDDEIPSSV